MKMNVEDVARKLGEIGPLFTLDEAATHLKMDKRRVEYYIHILKKRGTLINVGKRGIYFFADLRETYSVKLSELYSLLLSYLHMKTDITSLESKIRDILDDATNTFFFEHFLLGSTIVSPSAIAYFSAADYYGWCVRPPNITFIQTPVHRAYKNTVKWGNWNVIKIENFFFKIVTVKPSKFFGFEERDIGGRKILITDREKTIIDSLDKPKYAGTMEEVLNFLRNAKFDPDKLVEYLQRINNKTLIKRVGYVSEKYGWDIEEKLLNLLSEKDRRSFPLFDPNGPNTGKFDYRWGLRINVPDDYWWDTKWM